MASRPPRWVLALVLLLMVGPALLGAVIVLGMGTAGWYFYKEMPGVELASLQPEPPSSTLRWQGEPLKTQTLWLSYELRGCTLEGDIGGHTLRIEDGNPSVDGQVRARFFPSDEGHTHAAQVRIADFLPADEPREASIRVSCAEPGAPTPYDDLRLYVTNQR